MSPHPLPTYAEETTVEALSGV